MNTFTNEELFKNAFQNHQQGNFEQAKQLYWQMLELNPNNQAALNNLSSLVPPAEAIPLLRHLLKLQPNDLENIQQRLMFALNSKLNTEFHYNENFISDYPWITNGRGESCETQVANLTCALPFKGIFASDNLITWGRNLSFLGDQALLDAINECSDDLHMARGLIWRSSVVLWAVRNGLKREGDFVECGTYKGTTARIIHRAINLDKTNKTLWLYDIFDWKEGDKHTQLEALNSELYDHVKAIFKDATNVKIIKGYIPESFKKGIPEKISFLHIDMNNADGEIGALNTLWERVVPGGICILDDYGWECLSNQKKEEDGFFAQRGYTVLELPTGQGMILK